MSHMRFSHIHIRSKQIRKPPYVLFFFCATAPHWAMTSSFTKFLDHTQRRTTVGRTPTDEWSARRRDLYLTTHNIHNRQTSITTVGFEPTISAGERPQTYVLDRSAIGTGYITNTSITLSDKQRLQRWEVTNDICHTTSYMIHYLFMAQQPPSGSGPPHYQGFTIAVRCTTVGSTPLDEWSARRRDLYLTTHNTHKTQTPMPPAGLEPTP